MNSYLKKEEVALKKKGYPDYYPEIDSYHKNELLSYFDSLNLEFHLKRKERIKAIKSREEAEAHITDVRKKLKDLLGDIPEKDLYTEVVETVDMGRYLIDKVLIESLPGYFLTANFYYPKNMTKKIPSVLFLLGHTPNGKLGDLYITFCVEAVLNNLCVLTFDPIGQGERKMYTEEDLKVIKSARVDDMHDMFGYKAVLTGDNITRYMMTDNIRALDYLCTRKEVDTSKIAVTGNSGGGHMSALMGAYDDRISVILPSCYITEYKTIAYRVGVQETEQSIPGFMKYGLDIPDLILAAIPKPYFIGSALLDFMQIDGARDAFAEAKRFYSLFDKEDNIKIYTAGKPHGFWCDTRESALRFICKHFNMEFIQNKEIQLSDIPIEKDLICLSEEEFSKKSRHLSDILKQKADNLIKNEVSVNGVLKALCIEVNKINGDLIYKEPGVIKNSYEFSMYSQEGMKIYCTLYKNEVKNNSLLIYVGDDISFDRFKEYSEVLCIEPRGTGRTAPDDNCFFNLLYPENSLNCNAFMLGRNIQGMRVLDVISAISLITQSEDLTEHELTIYGKEENALTALYTALIVELDKVILEDLLCSYKSFFDHNVFNWGLEVFIPGVLKHFDIPDLLKALKTADVTVNRMLDGMKNVVK